ncbi:MAG: hypothetical protein ACJAZP_000550 [Psychromonas sp.]|jgi:hypothetical protein
MHLPLCTPSLFCTLSPINRHLQDLLIEGVTNLSGTNLNVGIYDNDLKGVGQDARSNLRQFSIKNGQSSASR